MSDTRERSATTWKLPFKVTRKPQRASRALKLPRKAPACFNSQKEWEAYHTLSVISGQNGHTFCTDCTPEYRERMVAEGRCRFPGTRFSKVNDVIVGQRHGKEDRN